MILNLMTTRYILAVACIFALTGPMQAMKPSVSEGSMTSSSSDGETCKSPRGAFPHHGGETFALTFASHFLKNCKKSTKSLEKTSASEVGRQGKNTTPPKLLAVNFSDSSLQALSKHCLNSESPTDRRVIFSLPYEHTHAATTGDLLDYMIGRPSLCKNFLHTAYAFAQEKPIVVFVAIRQEKNINYLWVPVGIKKEKRGAVVFKVPTKFSRPCSRHAYNIANDIVKTMQLLTKDELDTLVNQLFPVLLDKQSRDEFLNRPAALAQGADKIAWNDEDHRIIVAIHFMAQMFGKKMPAYFKAVLKSCNINVHSGLDEILGIA